MTKETTKKIDTLLSYNNINLHVSDYNISEVNDFDELMEELQQNNALDVEIIYYNKAMKYLSENDNSLQFSLELAHELGYELHNLNSETLASILATENMRNDLNEIESEINDILEQE